MHTSSEISTFAYDVTLVKMFLENRFTSVVLISNIDSTYD